MNPDRPTELISPQEAVHPGETLQSPPCPACGMPRDGCARFCGACGTPLQTPENSPSEDELALAGSTKIPKKREPQPTITGEQERRDDVIGTQPAAMPDHFFECKNCGSAIATQQDQRSYCCPFCDSSYVIELASQNSGQRPEFIIGFAVTKQQAQQKFFEWLGKNSFLRPGDLAAKSSTEKQRGVYLPFWHFSMEAYSTWNARIGQYWYRTETYTVTNSKGQTERRTRRVRETEWWPLSGSFRKYYSGYLVSASKGLPQKEALSIQPFDLRALVRFRPYFLAGWLSEEYKVAPEDAVSFAQQEFHQQQQRAIQRFLPGDTSSGLNVSSNFSTNGTDLVLLPVHVLSYRYRDKQYRFLVNGQTGRVIGEKPWSGVRISLMVAAIVVLILLVVFGILYATHLTN